jgi:hypothetical protein
MVALPTNGSPVINVSVRLTMVFGAVNSQVGPNGPAGYNPAGEPAYCASGVHDCEKPKNADTIRRVISRMCFILRGFVSC